MNHARLFLIYELFLIEKQLANNNVFLLKGNLKTLYFLSSYLGGTLTLLWSLCF
jgi:hypothetical protein